MAFKKGDRVKFKTDSDQWVYMEDMKIQTVNNDGTYGVVGKNPRLTRLYKTEYCSVLRVKECNLESDSEVENKFELGKFYKHTTGEKLYICGVVDTYAYGKALVGEDGYGNLIPIGEHEYAIENYHEITKKEFLDVRE